MKGTLIYFEPDEETGYKGNWVIQIPTEKPYNNIFSLSDESVKWIKENNPPKKIDVDFVVICDCHYDEETNTAKHALVATIKGL
jgi:hypothetical protein